MTTQSHYVPELLKENIIHLLNDGRYGKLAPKESIVLSRIESNNKMRTNHLRIVETKGRLFLEWNPSTIDNLPNSEQISNYMANFIGNLLLELQRKI